MSVTIDLIASSLLRSNDVKATARSAAEVAFRIEGVMTLTDALLSELAGRRAVRVRLAHAIVVRENGPIVVARRHRLRSLRLARDPW